MTETRREKILNTIQERLHVLSDVNNAYGVIVPTIAMDADHLEALDDRARLPAIHVMQGLTGTKSDTGQSLELGQVLETFPVLLRATVKGPTDQEPMILPKTVQMIQIHTAVERVLGGQNTQGAAPIAVNFGIEGVLDSFFTSFTQPQVREYWGSPWGILEMNFHVLHEYAKGGSP